MPTKPRTDRSNIKPDTRAYDAARGSAHERGYDKQWERLRRWKLNHDPLCAVCLEHGRSEPATDVDHIVAKRLGGTNHPSNLQSLCHSCHSQKTARERREWDELRYWAELAKARWNNAKYGRDGGIE